MANKTMHRVLIDNESLADIICASVFDKMGIRRENLELVNTHLLGFSGEKVLPLGSVQLVLTLGDAPCQVMSAKLIYVLSSFHMLFCAFYIHIHVKLIKFPLNLVL